MDPMFTPHGYFPGEGYAFSHDFDGLYLLLSNWFIVGVIMLLLRFRTQVTRFSARIRNFIAWGSFSLKEPEYKDNGVGL